MAIPLVLTRPPVDFQPKAGEDWQAYQARRALVAERRRIFDLLTAELRQRSWVDLIAAGWDARLPPADRIAAMSRFDWGNRR